MTGLKIALYTLFSACGLSTAMASVLVNTLQPILAQTGTAAAQQGLTVTNGTPFTTSMGWVIGGMTTAALFGWKISRAWSSMENRLVVLEDRQGKIEERCWRSDCPTPSSQSK